MQCLPGSLLPDDLRKLGYVVTASGETERIIPSAIVQHFALKGGRRDGIAYQRQH
jgi:hypothetical protein